MKQKMDDYDHSNLICLIKKIPSTYINYMNKNRIVKNWADSFMNL